MCGREGLWWERGLKATFTALFPTESAANDRRSSAKTREVPGKVKDPHNSPSHHLGLFLVCSNLTCINSSLAIGCEYQSDPGETDEVFTILMWEGLENVFNAIVNLLDKEPGIDN